MRRRSSVTPRRRGKAAPRWRSAVGLLVFLASALLYGGDAGGFEMLWERSFGLQGWRDHWFRAICEDARGDYFAAGAGYSQDDPLACDAYVVKLRADGSVAWDVRLDYGGMVDEAFAVAVAGDGCVVAGDTGAGSPCGYDCAVFSLQSKPDVYLAKLDGEGGLVWQRSFGGADIDAARAIHATPEGGYVVVGQTRSWGEGLEDVLVLKLSAKGDVLWWKTMGGPRKDVARAIAASKDGGYLIVGESESFTPNRSLYVLRIDEEGGLLWQKTIGEGATFSANAVMELTFDASYFVAGYAGSAGYVVRLDSAGEVLWSRTLDGPRLTLRAVAELANGVILAAGIKPLGENRLSAAYAASIDPGGITVHESLFTFEGRNVRIFGAAAVTGGGAVLAGDMSADKMDAYVLRLESRDGLFRRGDVDGDAVLRLTDGVLILSFLFRGEQEICLDSMDTNDDGKINVTDAVVLFNYLFRGGGSLPEPAGREGLDPTPDELGCPSR